jgi:hypothetical protein
MQHQETDVMAHTGAGGLLGKGVRDLCDAARSWCAKLEVLASTTGSASLPASLARSFARVLGGADYLDGRGLVLLVINAIRLLIARLLADETRHRETLANLPSTRSRRDAAIEELYGKLKAFRQLGMSNRKGPVIPPGALPRQPDQLAAVAAAVRPQLDCEGLAAAPWVRILPTLRPSFDQATAELAFSTAAVEEALEASRETRNARDASMDELRVHVTAARSLHQALCDLKALDPGEK